MSFYGSGIIFDGIPSETFGLILADMDMAKQDSGKIGGKSVIQESRTPFRHDAIHGGIVQNEGLSFALGLVLGDGEKRFDRYDLARISGWLTGHQQYRELILCQRDMASVFFKAIVTELETIEVGMQPVGVKATFTCDAPYAYRRLCDTAVPCTGETTYLYRNESNINDYYYPIIVFEGVGTNLSLSVDGDGVFSLRDMSPAEKTVTIDCKDEIITSSDGANLYAGWNLDADKWTPRLRRGDNTITVSGAKSVRIKNEFPWSVGY